MTPYQVHLDAWTLAMYATDDGRLTFTVSNSEEGDHYLTPCRRQRQAAPLLPRGYVRRRAPPFAMADL